MKDEVPGSARRRVIANRNRAQLALRRPPNSTYCSNIHRRPQSWPAQQQYHGGAGALVAFWRATPASVAVGARVNDAITGVRTLRARVVQRCAAPTARTTPALAEPIQDRFPNGKKWTSKRYPNFMRCHPSWGLYCGDVRENSLGTRFRTSTPSEAAHEKRTKTRCA